MRKAGKGKMKLDAAVTQVMAFEAAFRGIICEASRKSLTHGEILKLRKTRIFDHANWSRLPMWGQAQVQSFTSGALAVLDCTMVDWQLYLDGERVNSPDVPKGRWGDVSGRMEWKHSGERYQAGERSVG